VVKLVNKLSKSSPLIVSFAGGGAFVGAEGCDISVVDTLALDCFGAIVGCSVCAGLALCLLEALLDLEEAFKLSISASKSSTVVDALDDGIEFGDGESVAFCGCEDVV